MKTFIIWLIVIIAVLGLGYYFVHTSNTSQVSTTATSTQTAAVGNTNTSGSTTAPTQNAPTVETSDTTSTSNSTAVVTGRVKPNGAPTTYWFEYGETTALGSRTSTQSIGSGYSYIPTPAYITGLKANTLYYFRLSASNRIATVVGATYTLQTNSNPPPQGRAPTVRTLPATSVSRTTGNVNGQVNPNSSDTTYWFEYGTDTSLGTVTTFDSAGNGSGQLSVAVSLTGLTPLTKYYFRFNAQNDFGTVNGPTLSFTTTGPASPGQPTVQTTGATNIASTSVTLNGHLNPNGADTTYWFEYSEDSLLGSLIGNGTPQQTLANGADTTTVSADVSNLATHTRYFSRVVGQNRYGTVRGPIMSFTTKQ